MASPEAVERGQRNPCLSEALTHAMTHQDYNLALRGTGNRATRVITYTPVSCEAKPAVPLLQFGKEVDSFVSGPAYDRNCEVVQAGTAWVHGAATFVPSSKGKKGKRRSEENDAHPITEFPVAAPILVGEHIDPSPRDYPRSARSAAGGDSRRLYERPRSAQSRAGSACSHERPMSAQSRVSDGRRLYEPREGGARPPRPGSASRGYPRPWSAGSRASARTESRPGSAREASRDTRGGYSVSVQSSRSAVGRPPPAPNPEAGSIQGGRFSRIRTQ